MARKPSVILSAAERKQAGNDLATQIKNQKALIKGKKDQLKELDKGVKAEQKALAALEKELTGLETRKAALNPPKPLHVAAA